MVAFCGKISALSRWNLQMSQCKCPGDPRGQPPGMAADKCIMGLGDEPVQGQYNFNGDADFVSFIELASALGSS